MRQRTAVVLRSNTGALRNCEEGFPYRTLGDLLPGSSPWIALLKFSRSERILWCVPQGLWRLAEACHCRRGLMSHWIEARPAQPGQQRCNLDGGLGGRLYWTLPQRGLKPAALHSFELVYEVALSSPRPDLLCEWVERLTGWDPLPPTHQSPKRICVPYGWLSRYLPTFLMTLRRFGPFHLALWGREERVELQFWVHC